MGVKQEAESGVEVKKEGILKNADKTEQNTESGEKKHNQSVQHPTSNPVVHGYDYSGKNKDIGVILALQTERYSKKVVFSVFIEKLKNYVLTNFTEAKDIVTL